VNTVTRAQDSDNPCPLRAQVRCPDRDWLQAMSAAGRSLFRSSSGDARSRSLVLGKGASFLARNSKCDGRGTEYGNFLSVDNRCCGCRRASASAWPSRAIGAVCGGFSWLEAPAFATTAIIQMRPLSWYSGRLVADSDQARAWSALLLLARPVVRGVYPYDVFTEPFRKPLAIRNWHSSCDLR
jgi:hypothetical protein